MCAHEKQHPLGWGEGTRGLLIRLFLLWFSFSKILTSGRNVLNFKWEKTRRSAGSSAADDAMRVQTLSSLWSPPWLSTGPACHMHRILTASRKQRQRNKGHPFPTHLCLQGNQYFSESSRRLSFTWPWTELDVLPSSQNKFYRLKLTPLPSHPHRRLKYINQKLIYSFTRGYSPFQWPESLDDLLRAHSY